jgi:FkbM family methyltransferase
MTGATGNVYAGLHEFEDMAFVLHVLRPDELLLDVGANVGSYTVLASKVLGARCIAFEPVPATFAALQDNVHLNGVADRVDLRRVAVGRQSGVARMTTELDTGNRIAELDGAGDATIEVPMVALDDVEAAAPAGLVKIDVEGHEASVLAGARRLLSSPSLLGVIMETNRSALAYGRSETEAHSALLEAGLSPHGYAPFERRLIPLGRGYNLDANTLYLRDVARVEERVRGARSFRVLGQHV